MRVLLILVLLAAGALRAADTTYVRVDTTAGDAVLQIFTAVDTLDLPGRLTGKQWPNNQPVKLFGAKHSRIDTVLDMFVRDSVETGGGYKTIWWSGCCTWLEDSVVKPMQYRLSGDSLVIF